MLQPTRVRSGLGWRCAAAFIAAVVIASCGGGGGTTPPSATPTATPTPKGPAKAQFTLLGDASVAGPITNTNARIVCLQPGLKGFSLSVLGDTVTNGVQAFILLTPGSLQLNLGSGSGTTLSLRTFTGTGVTGFDAATGASINSTLTENTSAATAKGTIGKVTSITGKLDCGDQVAGTSTLTMSGTTAVGQVSGGFESVRVVCQSYKNGSAVSVHGLTHIGSTLVQFTVSLYSTGLLSAFALASNQVSSSFASAVNTSNGTLTAGGAHFNGTVTENPSGRLLTVKGDATCGSHNSY